MIDISNLASISDLCDIEDSIRGTLIKIGDYSVIDSFVKIKPVGGTGDVVLGSHTYLNSGCVIYSGNGVNIGNNVSVAANCTFAPTNHAYAEKQKNIQEQGFLTSKGGIVIEDDVWVGANCVFLDGAYVEKGTVIAAGSVVRSRLVGYCVYAGSPLRKVGERT